MKIQTLLVQLIPNYTASRGITYTKWEQQHLKSCLHTENNSFHLSVIQHS